MSAMYHVLSCLPRDSVAANYRRPRYLTSSLHGAPGRLGLRSTDVITSCRCCIVESDADAGVSHATRFILFTARVIATNYRRPRYLTSSLHCAPGRLGLRSTDELSVDVLLYIGSLYICLFSWQL
ncbi:hypothetical protein J6590_007779 [Homalodisca vitripennis]|nr:hypothetical protein J6590_007779 [Homalodisca vitripennis]